MKKRFRPISLEAYSKPLYVLVIDILREAIINGTLRPGEKILEGRLAEELGISRTPVREALRNLEQEGFIRIIPRKGVCVAEFSEEDIEETFQVRTALELLAVELASARIDAAGEAALRKVLQEEEEAIESGDLVAQVSKDTEFHEHIYRIAGNQKLIQVMSNLREQITRFRFVSIGGRGRGKEVLLEHEGIFEALVRKDADLARERIYRHVQSTKEALLEAIRRSREKSGEESQESDNE